MKYLSQNYLPKPHEISRFRWLKNLELVRLPDDISLQLEAQAISTKVVFFRTELVFIFKSLVQIEIIR